MDPINSYPVYRLGGRSILFDRPIAELRSFAAGKANYPRFPGGTLAESPTGAAAMPGGPDQTQPIRATGWIGAGLVTVSAWRNATGWVLEIPGAGSFWTAADGGAVGRVSSEVQVKPAFMNEIQLGAPLVLALALQDCWCLHASCAVIRGRAAVFLGETGLGKSTLSAFLNQQERCQRLADDILPVTWEGQALQAHPHFPQLKLPGDQHPASGFPESIPVAALYILDEGPEIAIQALSKGRAALAMISHTAAARLFDRQLLEQHLVFCSQAAAHTPIRRLVYPRRFDQLPPVLAALQADLAALTA